jgi:hypothetical protein
VKLLDSLLEAWCMFRVASLPTLAGAVLGGVLFLNLGPPLGFIAGGVVAFAGVLTGVIWANAVRKKGRLFELSQGFRPTESAPGSDADKGAS